ncbi:MAG: flippase [Patescibacteria group bacterium]|jgi:O-antigen/teichoic acid export membrane protein
MSLAKKVAQNTLVQIIGKIVSTILGIFSLALMTRYLGQAGFGDYTTINTFLTFFAVIADFGLTLVTVQMISGTKSRQEEEKILSNLFSLRLVSALLLIGLAPIVVYFFPYSQLVRLGVLITALAFVFPALNQVLIGLFQKKLSMGRATLAEVLSRVALLVGIIISELVGGGLVGILLATLASGLISFLLHFLLAIKFATIRFAYDFSLWKTIIHRAWPLALTIILNLIYLRSDILLLSIFKEPEAVGLYGAAYRIIDVLATLPFMFAGLVLPILTSAWLQKNQATFFKVLQKSLDLMIILAVPLLIGAQFLATPIMTLVAGTDFRPAGIILKILIFSVAATFISTILTHAVVALNKQKKLIGFYAFTGFSSLLAYFLLISKYSYLGAAAVAVYSEVLMMFFSVYCVFKYSHFLPNLKTLGKSLLAGLLMGALLFIFPPASFYSLGSLFLILTVASLTYFIFLFLFKGFSSQDLRAIFAKSIKETTPTYRTDKL